LDPFSANAEGHCGRRYNEEITTSIKYRQFTCRPWLQRPVCYH